jgi:hypothetical protein
MFSAGIAVPISLKSTVIIKNNFNMEFFLINYGLKILTCIMIN